MALPTLDPAAALGWLTRRTVRVGVTGLARAGKTAFLTSVAANLLALGAGRPVLPALRRHLGARTVRVAPAPADASPVPRFDAPAHVLAPSLRPAPTPPGSRRHGPA